jgi:drug/metabolite transporter (DMT)-like permease
MKYYGLVFSAACLWGAIGVIGRSAFQYGMSPLEVSFWRAAISSSLFVLHAVSTQQLRLRRPRDLILFILFGLLAVSLFNASYFLAVQHGGVTLATIMLYTAPAFVAIVAHFLFGEKLSAYKISLICLTVGGISLISLTSGGPVQIVSTALAWGLVSGATYALYYLFGKYILPRYQTVTVMALAMPIGAVGLAPMVSFGFRPWPAWLAVAGLAVISTYVAYQLYYAGLRHIEASRAVLVASIEPVVASFLAAVFYGEQLSWSGYLGATLVIGSAIASSWPTSEG